MTSGLRQSILNLIANGLTDTQIAQRLGVTRNSVIGHRHRAGLACNKSPDAIAQGSKRGAGQKFPNWKGGIGAKATEARQSTRTCKYIEGDPRTPGWSYCGKRVCRAESSYCQRHDDLCHTKARTPEQQAAVDLRMATARAAKGMVA